MTSRFTVVVVGSLISIALGLNSSLAVAAPATKTASSASVDQRLTLKNIRTAASKIRRNSLEVINDVTQRKMNDETGDPIFFEPSNQQAEKDPSIYAKETANWGKIEAPKKSWLDADVSHLDQWVKAQASYINELPEPTQPNASDAYKQLQNIQNDLDSNMKNLKSLTKGPQYNNMAIAKAAMAIYEGVKKLESPWKTAMKNCNSK